LEIFTISNKNQPIQEDKMENKKVTIWLYSSIVSIYCYFWFFDTSASSRRNVLAWLFIKIELIQNSLDKWLFIWHRNISIRKTSDFVIHEHLFQLLNKLSLCFGADKLISCNQLNYVFHVCFLFYRVLVSKFRPFTQFFLLFSS
jgi:hypothetical protein